MMATITPRVTTRITHLFSAIYRDHNPIYNCFVGAKCPHGNTFRHVSSKRLRLDVADRFPPAILTSFAQLVPWVKKTNRSRQNRQSQQNPEMIHHMGVSKNNGIPKS